MNEITKNGVNFRQSMNAAEFVIAVRDLFEKTKPLVRKDPTVRNVDIHSIEWKCAKRMWINLIDNHHDIATVLSTLLYNKEDKKLFYFIYLMGNKNCWFNEAMKELEQHHLSRFKKIKKIFMDNLVPNEESSSEILDATQTC